MLKQMDKDFRHVVQIQFDAPGRRSSRDLENWINGAIHDAARREGKNIQGIIVEHVLEKLIR